MKKINKIFDIEWKKAIKNLIKSTPKGQIRFDLIDFEKLKNKINRKVKVNNLEELLIEYLKKTYQSSSILCMSSFHDFPPYEDEAETMAVSLTYGSTPKYQMLLVFYANKPQSNPNCADDLITHWFAEYVLPAFKEFRRTPVPKDVPLLAHPIVKAYSYAPISLALHHFGYRLTLSQYKETFSMLGDIHGRTITIDVPDTIIIY
jgi:hypothetical protein